MRRFLALLRANLLMLLRNRQALFWSLAFPLVFMFLLGVVFGDEGGSEASLGFVDKDGSLLSQGLVRALNATGRLKVEQGDEAELMKRLKSGDVAAVVIIPAGFGEKLGVPGGPPPAAPVTVEVAYDPSSVFASQVATGTVAAVVEGFQKQLLRTPELVRTEFRSVQKESLSYRDFLIPGILAMALLTSGVIGIATTVVFFREQGILRRVQVTPLPVGVFMLARVVTQLVISLMQAVVLLGVGRLVFGVHVGRNVPVLLLMLIVGTLSFVFMGFFISSFTRTVEATSAVANVVTMPMMFLGGIFFPVDGAPSWIQPVVKLMPVKYLADGLRDVMIRGRGLAEVWTDMVFLSGVALVFALLSLRVFRWRE